MKRIDTQYKKMAEKSLMERLKLFFKTEGRDFFQKPLVFWLIAISLLINAINWLVLEFFVKAVDSSIILHYNVYFGVDMIGSQKMAFFMPAMGLFLLLINVMLSLFFYQHKERIASYVLLLAVLMIQLSLLIASISVIIINY